jgi:hypothetical protein
MHLLISSPYQISFMHGHGLFTPVINMMVASISGKFMALPLLAVKEVLLELLDPW